MSFTSEFGIMTREKGRRLVEPDLTWARHVCSKPHCTDPGARIHNDFPHSYIHLIVSQHVYESDSFKV